MMLLQFLDFLFEANQVMIALPIVDYRVILNIGSSWWLVVAVQDNDQ